ncbi:MAG: metallophosphoesterase, partial [Bacteroidetes bacterium]|nr:metallophosphoesterase [Bacteroidota bacterium]
MTGPRALLLVSVLALSGCAATRTYVAPARHTPEIAVSADDVEYEVFLLGNTGSGEVDDAAPVLLALARELRNASEESAVVFLGDQLDAGMPDSAAASRGEANRRLAMIAESVNGFDGRVFVVPGDHDWDGPESVRRQEEELERLLGRDDVFIPGDARSGPVVLELNDNIVLVGLDTAWWLEDEPRPIGDAGDVANDEGGYEITNPGDIIFAMEDILKEYDDENVLVVGHHPLRSNGPHGGQFSLGRHLLPLPIIGSAYPLYRQFAGTRQDLAHPRYRAHRTALSDVFRTRDRVIYAAAHERSLQAFPLNTSVKLTQHYLISGSAARSEPVASGRGAGLASSDRGFMRIRYMKDGSVWLDTFSVDPATGESTVIYHSRLYGRALDRIEPDVPDIDLSSLPSYADSTVIQAVSQEYETGRAQRALLGSGYRTAWATPVEFPVLDLDVHGGLTPIRKGGGFQTLSLRMQAGDGHQYVLRLLNKVTGRLLPGPFQESIVANVLDDLASATIPWAALAVAELADDAGIYHTNPRLVLIPDDPRLGVYREEFGNRLALFEERPNDDMSDNAGMGNSENVISSAKMFGKVEGDNDHRVDQRFFLRSRLFDMLIGDWDRHADQWRWATFEPFELDPSLEGDARTKGKIYRPIPPARDY